MSDKMNTDATPNGADNAAEASTPVQPESREPVPGCPPAPPRFDDGDFHICGSCFELRRPRQKSDQEAAIWCNCDRANSTGPKPTWRGNDLRGWFRLCWCCGAAMNVGCSKMSIQVCKPCFHAIRDLSSVVGMTVAPFGRHSIHSGISLRTDKPYVDQDLVDMATGLDRMVRSIAAADKHRRARTAELAHRFGFFGQERIDIWDYFAYCTAAGVQRDGLASLIQFSADRATWEAESPVFRRSTVVG